MDHLSPETARLAALDRSALWHPFTQQQGWHEEDAPIIASGRGTTLTDTEGREYIDGTSALRCNVHGHGHPSRLHAVGERRVGRSD